MRLSIGYSEEIVQDVIRGTVTITKLGCFTHKKIIHGSICLFVVMTLNKHMGLFSKRRVIIHEEIQDLQLSTEMPNHFEFQLCEIEQSIHKKLPDSYNGFGVNIQYFVVVHSFLFTVKKEIIVKSKALIEEKPETFTINKNDINNFDGLLCISDVDFIPEIHILCNINSSNTRMVEGIKGTIKVEQCNIQIHNISVGIVQNEDLVVRGVHRNLQIVRETIEVATGNCVRNREIPFFFIPDISGISRDYKCEDATISFSLRVKIQFSNGFYCIKYIPVHFSW